MSSRWMDGGYAAQGSSEFAWKGGLALKRVHALNERCLEVLSELARGDDPSIMPATMSPLRSLWRDSSSIARKRAAQTPFLLVDLHFRDARWWRDARDPHSSRGQPNDPNPAFAGPIAGELMRETLMLAWSTVSLDRGSASMLFGMAPAVITIVAELNAHDVEHIAARHSQHLRPRWEDVPAFWVGLLQAARDGDERALHRIHLQGVQLIGRDLLPLLDGRFV